MQRSAFVCGVMQRRKFRNRFLRIFRDDRSHGIDRRTCGQGFQRPHDRIMLQARNHDMASLAQQALEHHIECHGTVQGKYHMRRILQMKNRAAVSRQR